MKFKENFEARLWYLGGNICGSALGIIENVEASRGPFLIPYAARNPRDVLCKKLEPGELQRGKDGAGLTSVIWAGLEGTDVSLCSVSASQTRNSRQS